MDKSDKKDQRRCSLTAEPPNACRCGILAEVAKANESNEADVLLVLSYIERRGPLLAVREGRQKSMQQIGEPIARHAVTAMRCDAACQM